MNKMINEHDEDLKAGEGPVDEAETLGGLNGGDGRIDVFGDHIAAIEEAAGYVLALVRIAFDHVVIGTETSGREFADGNLVVGRLFGRNERRVGGHREVDARIRHQIRLELVQIDVERSVEPQRSRDGRHHLTDDAVETGVAGLIDGQIAPADVVDGFVVHEEGTVRVFHGGVGRQNRVVGLDDGCSDVWRRIDGKFQFGSLAVLVRQRLHEQGREARAGAAAQRVEHDEALQGRALLGQSTEAVDDRVDQRSTGRVVAARVVVGCVFLPADQLLGLVELAVGAHSDLVHYARLQVDHDGPRYMSPVGSFAEERVETVVAVSCGSLR